MQARGFGQRLRHGLVDCGKPINSREVVFEDTIIRLVSCLHAEGLCWSGAVDTEVTDSAAAWRARSRTNAVSASRASAADVGCGGSFPSGMSRGSGPCCILPTFGATSSNARFAGLAAADRAAFLEMLLALARGDDT